MSKRPSNVVTGKMQYLSSVMAGRAASLLGWTLEQAARVADSEALWGAAFAVAIARGEEAPADFATEIQFQVREGLGSDWADAVIEADEQWSAREADGEMG